MPLEIRARRLGYCRARSDPPAQTPKGYPVCEATLSPGTWVHKKAALPP